ncbi:hypothetical protein [Halalkalibacter alkaliphilus]|uniref:Uncharacterized protein n=1 Tax=Halalkalibacter alkaliphilus TaxID=2917993 RepID=A0A9X2I471_9BACI|nr:hypothetical protein [Halalkalibacter alkaliphilus]MCL7747308.1 hypothetical protein [Halalkalibacter alkaliphilus]
MKKFSSGTKTEKDMEKSGSDSNHRTPTWVKVIGIIVILIAVLVIIMIFTGDHGPGRHLPSGGSY